MEWEFAVHYRSDTGEHYLAMLRNLQPRAELTKILFTIRYKLGDSWDSFLERVRDEARLLGITSVVNIDQLTPWELDQRFPRM